MTNRDILISDLNDISEILNNNGYGIWSASIQRAVVMLKEWVPKTGHWIYLQDCANEGVYCSECHTKMFDRYPMKKKLSQFCAHCGAKMDEEVEGR